MLFTPPPGSMSHIVHYRLAIVLAVTVALGPFALDAYLPAFTAIAADFDITVSEVGLTLSTYVIALAVGQLVGGPLADRFGRARIMFSGLVIFFIGSLLVVFSESLQAMMIGRVIQAFGGGWSTVGVPAIARDRTEGNETARLFSLIAMIMFVAPAIAPSLGTLLLALGGWHAIFVFLAAYAIVTALLLQRVVFRESETRATSNEPLHRLVTNYAHVLRNVESLHFIAIQAFVFSVMLVYLTHAAFIYQSWLGFSKTGFSLLFALNVGVMMASSLANRRLLLARRSVDVLAGALAVQAIALLALTLIVMLDLPRLLAVPALAAGVGMLGAIAPNNMSGALRPFKVYAGTAAALMGSIQFAFSGLVGTLSALAAGEEMHVVVASMLACSIAAMLLVRSARRLVNRRENASG